MKIISTCLLTSTLLAVSLGAILAGAHHHHVNSLQQASYISTR